MSNQLPASVRSEIAAAAATNQIRQQTAGVGQLNVVAAYSAARASSQSSTFPEGVQHDFGVKTVEALLHRKLGIAPSTLGRIGEAISLYINDVAVNTVSSVALGLPSFVIQPDEFGTKVCAEIRACATEIAKLHQPETPVESYDWRPGTNEKGAYAKQLAAYERDASGIIDKHAQNVARALDVELPALNRTPQITRAEIGF